MSRLAAKLFLAGAAALLAEPLAAETAGEVETGIFSFVLENDAVADEDRHYTNGLRLSYLVGPGSEPGLIERGAKLLPFVPEESRVRVGFALGQNMYTPRVIDLPDPDPDDRPYAGWLYASVIALAETGRQLDQLELSLGVVGPASFAEETQKFVHDITGSDEPLGWDTQLENELAVVLFYRRSWRALASGTLLGFGFDATPHVGAALGNVFTYANAGATLRFGLNLPDDYGPPRIAPGPGGSEFFKPRAGFGWYLFAGVDGRAVARNIFLDGNTFEDSRSVDKKIFVGDLQAGVALLIGGVRIAYTHVLRSKEFDTQDSEDQFGALSLSVRF